MPSGESMNQKASLKSRGNDSFADTGFLPGQFLASLTRSNPASVEWLTDLLVRSVRQSADQAKLVNSLSQLALTDELTGLYSRRGFMVLARQQMKMARRMKQRVLLLYCDVDGLKGVNDRFGHHEGDLALRKVAAVLRRTFRDSDVIARIGGDEFTVFALETAEYREADILARLSDNMKNANCGEAHYSLSLSVGMARSARERSTSLEELMSCADKAMYAHKRMDFKLVSNA